MTNQDCVFCRIVAGQLPCTKRFEDADIFAFDDIHPVEPVHILVVPKKHVADLHQADADLAGKMQMAIAKLAEDLKIRDGYKVELNAGRYQEVPHLHYHLKGGVK